MPASECRLADREIVIHPVHDPGLEIGPERRPPQLVVAGGTLVAVQAPAERLVDEMALRMEGGQGRGHVVPAFGREVSGRGTLDWSADS